MTDKIVIRPARAREIVDLAELAARSFRDAFGGDNDKNDVDAYINSSMTVDKFNKEFRNENNIFLVACSEDSDKLKGYAKLRSDSIDSCVIGESPIEIERLYADSSVIGKGVGAALIIDCQTQARSMGCDVIWLGVWERNERAIEFYERWGFSIVGDHQFTLGSDVQIDLIMRKSLLDDDR